MLVCSLELSHPAKIFLAAVRPGQDSVSGCEAAKSTGTACTGIWSHTGSLVVTSASLHRSAADARIKPIQAFIAKHKARIKPTRFPSPRLEYNTITAQQLHKLTVSYVPCLNACTR